MVLARLGVAMTWLGLALVWIWVWLEFGLAWLSIGLAWLELGLSSAWLRFGVALVRLARLSASGSSNGEQCFGRARTIRLVDSCRRAPKR